MTDNTTEINLETATWQYIQYLQEQNKSSITVNAYTWDLKQVMAFLEQIACCRVSPWLGWDGF